MHRKSYCISLEVVNCCRTETKYTHNHYSYVYKGEGGILSLCARALENLFQNFEYTLKLLARLWMEYAKH